MSYIEILQAFRESIGQPYYIEAEVACERPEILRVTLESYCCEVGVTLRVTDVLIGGITVEPQEFAGVGLTPDDRKRYTDEYNLDKVVVDTDPSATHAELHLSERDGPVSAREGFEIHLVEERIVGQV